MLAFTGLRELLSIQQYDRHSTTAKGVNEIVNWEMKLPKISLLFSMG
jgi:hypothetical protein